MVLYPLQCTKNPLILTSTCNGTVITVNRGEHDNNQSTTNNNPAQPANNQDASSTNTKRNNSNKNYIGQVVIPYTQGTAKAFKTYVVSMVSRYTSRAIQQ